MPGFFMSIDPLQCLTVMVAFPLELQFAFLLVCFPLPSFEQGIGIEGVGVAAVEFVDAVMQMRREFARSSGRTVAGRSDGTDDFSRLDDIPFFQALFETV